MRNPSLSEIKKELATLPTKSLMELCLKLAKYKKENKEFVSYLLFDAADEENFIHEVKAQMDLQFLELNKLNVYLAKKVFRKALKIATKHIKFSKIAETEAELLLYFCEKVKDTGIKIAKYPILYNLYFRQLEKSKKAILKLHEDLQYDYQQKVELLSL